MKRKQSRSKRNKDFQVYIDYAEIVNVKAKSKEEAVKKVEDMYDQQNININLADEAEFRAEEIK